MSISKSEYFKKKKKRTGKETKDEQKPKNLLAKKNQNKN